MLGEGELGEALLEKLSPHIEAYRKQLKDEER
jgi:hypothetical protein